MDHTNEKETVSSSESPEERKKETDLGQGIVRAVSHVTDGLSETFFSGKSDKTEE